MEVYKLTSKFPDGEKYALTSQANRSVVSIVSNIAEGAGRNSDKEFNNFLGITLGSSCEPETHMIVANKLEYITREELGNIGSSISEIQKMIVGLQRNLRSQIYS